MWTSLAEKWPWTRYQAKRTAVGALNHASNRTAIRRRWLFMIALVTSLLLYMYMCTITLNVRPPLRIGARPPPVGVTTTLGVGPPMTPSNLTNPTVASNSFFYIKNPKVSYNTCDVLELYIEVRDGHNLTKKMGGDLLWPIIQTDELQASAPYDELTDHGNRSYSARLTLSWAGVVEPRVNFVHSAEYVAALWGVFQRQPVRFAYVSRFTANGTSEFTPCHTVKKMPYIATKPEKPFSFLSPTEACDYSDTKAGTNWYCLKPKTLPCSAISQHKGDWKASDEFFDQIMTAEEKIVWKRGIKDFANLRNTGPVKSVSVLQAPGRTTGTACRSLPECTPGLPPKPPSLAAGFYYKDSWKSNVCRQRSFKLSEILQCLRNKRLYFYGDSTLRYWMLFLSRNLGRTMKLQSASNSQKIIGPLYAIDKTYNITLTFRHHDFPIRNAWLNFHDVKFTVNELDALPGGPNTVVLFTFCAHFTSTSVEYYANRMGLQQRGPSPSPVFFKSANTRAEVSKWLTVSNFFMLEIDQIMRTIFSGMPNVTIIDAWGMTLSHRTGYELHPVDLVLREEIKMFLIVLLCATQ